MKSIVNIEIIRDHILLFTISLIVAMLFFRPIHVIAEYSPPADPVKTLSDLALLADQGNPSRLYIPENKKLVPYLVLSEDPVDGCLLLREQLLDEPMRFNGETFYASFYGDSEIDAFLNSAFIGMISEPVRNAIRDTAIEITRMESIGISGMETEKIYRKVYLLSYTEVGGVKSPTSPEEGSVLRTLAEGCLAAMTPSGEAEGWWLRTPNTWYFNAVYLVTDNGSIAIQSVGGTEGRYERGVRPAFRIDSDIEIELIEGQFVIDETNLMDLSI